VTPHLNTVHKGTRQRLTAMAEFAKEGASAGDADDFFPETDSLRCRYYENQFPEPEEVVMANVTSIGEMGAYVTLLEYDNIEGMILLSELSRRRIRSINKLVSGAIVSAIVTDKVDQEIMLPGLFLCMWQRNPMAHVSSCACLIRCPLQSMCSRVHVFDCW
jgi:hypothetical protein